MSEELIALLADMREEEALSLAHQLLESGASPVEILDASRRAMELVGKRFEANEYFVPELILAGEMLKEISHMVKPMLVTTESATKRGCIVLGTVEGDIHDIGKDIVYFMLDVNGFEVIDLGVDVPANAFVDAVLEYSPSIVALSGFLTLAYDSMKLTVEKLAEAGLREGVKVMIGGGTIDERVCAYSGADSYGGDALEAVEIAKRWIPGPS